MCALHKLALFLTVTVLLLIGCNRTPTQYTLDCDQPSNPPPISETFLSAIGSPNRAEASQIVYRYLTQAVCQQDLSGDTSFSPEPFFFTPADLSQQYDVLSYSQAGFRSPGHLLVEFDNGTQLNFCFSQMVIHCNRAESCQCPQDFNWDPVEK